MEQFYGTGRRKAAVARVFLRPGGGRITVNGKDFQDYFRGILVGVQALEPLKVTGTAGRYDAVITVKGGGPSGQADAIKLGVARALIGVNPEFRVRLKPGGYLTPRRERSRAQKVRPSQSPSRTAVQQALSVIITLFRLGRSGSTFFLDAFPTWRRPIVDTKRSRYL